MTTGLEIRTATQDDLVDIVDLLADDDLGATRERPGRPLAPAYQDAFAAMQAQQGNLQLVATLDGDIVGCLQLTLIPGLTRLGSKRAQIEGVRVARAHRGAKIGERMIGHAIEVARNQGCTLLQLTTDARRTSAHAFYTRLGFEASHVGMKMGL